jgi:CheY-like chemotaxis protein
VSHIRVLVVDDNDDFLEVVAEWLTDNPDLGIVGTARSGRQAIEQVERLAPDLVLMDVTMPEMNGFEASRRIKANADAPRVVLMTLHESQAARHEAWAAGADELIAKVHLIQRLTAFVREHYPARRGAVLDSSESPTAADGTSHSPRPQTTATRSGQTRRPGKQEPPRDRS